MLQTPTRRKKNVLVYAIFLALLCVFFFCYLTIHFACNGGAWNSGFLLILYYVTEDGVLLVPWLSASLCNVPLGPLGKGWVSGQNVRLLNELESTWSWLRRTVGSQY